MSKPVSIGYAVDASGGIEIGSKDRGKETSLSVCYYKGEVIAIIVHSLHFWIIGGENIQDDELDLYVDDPVIARENLNDLRTAQLLIDRVKNKLWKWKNI